MIELYFNIPKWYICACGKKGVKLWRNLDDHRKLACAACVRKTDPAREIGADGMSTSACGTTDNFGPYIPAVPYFGGPREFEYWGYMSIPTAGVLWWKALPLEPIKC